MSMTDIDAVAARRAAIARDKIGLDEKRVVLLAEDEELALTERVLNRLDKLMHAEYPVEETEYVPAEPMHRRALGALKAVIAQGRRADEAN